MNYQRISKEIFDDILNAYNGAIAIEKSKLNQVYKDKGIEFNFEYTKIFFKKLNLIFTDLKEAPFPFNIHGFTGLNNHYLILDPESDADPFNLLNLD